MDLNVIASIAEESDVADNVGEIVKGRTLQADVDFFCHACAWLDKPLEANYKSLVRMVDKKRRLARAERVNIHITLGLKGGRNEIATVKPYQNGRKVTDKAKADRVLQLRSRLAFDTNLPSNMRVIADMTQEADDTLRAMQEDSIEKHGIESSVLMSGDKDLWFTWGYHIDPETGEVYFVPNDYGTCQYRDVGNKSLKLIGRGTSFFWHQMIMGDGADDIPGLPMLSGRLANVYLPTKKPNPNRKALTCGEAKAVAMLKNVTTNKEACKRVEEAYYDHYGAEYKERIVEQAYLLWIRKTNRVTEVIDMLNTYGKGYSFSEKQKTLLRGYFETVKTQEAMRKVALADS